jgi:transposase InsO family protein
MVNPRHSDENCFSINQKKRKEWEEKTGKTWKLLSKSTDNNKNKGSDDDDSGHLSCVAISCVTDIADHINSHSPICVSHSKNAIDRDRWLVDTGASNHLARTRSVFETYEEFSTEAPIFDTANGPTKALGVGMVLLKCPLPNRQVRTLKMKKVYHVPTVPINLFGAMNIVKNGGLVGRGKMVDSQDREMAQVDDDLLIVEQSADIIAPAILTPAVRRRRIGIRTWHRRLGHLGYDNVRKTQAIVRGMDFEEDIAGDSPEAVCDPCARAKPIRTVRRHVDYRPKKIFDEMNVDVVMLTPTGIGSIHYATVMTDGATRMRWVYTHKDKKGAFQAIQAMIKIAKTQYNRTIKKWRLDGGREYSPARLQELADDLGMLVELTTPYFPEQDAVSERSIRTLIERSRSAILDQDIPEFLWPEVLRTMAHITNRIATRALDGITLYEAFMNQVEPGENHRPSVAHFRVLGCKTYVLIPKEKRVISRKVTSRAEVGILVGFDGQHIYKVYVPSRTGPPLSKIVRSSCVRFDEGGLITDPQEDDTDKNDDEFHIPGSVSQNIRNRGEETHENEDRESNTMALVPEVSINSDVQKPITIQKVALTPTEYEHTPGDDTDSEDHFYELLEEEVQTQSAPDVNVDATSDIPKKKTRGPNKQWTPNPEYERITRSKKGTALSVNTSKIPHVYRATLIEAPKEPVTDDPADITEAMATKEADKWKLAVDHEYASLRRKKTWTLTQRSKLPPGVKVLRGKLVLKTKRDKDGNIEKHKARWVVRGFEQKYGQDYEQTYAGVCRSNSWKTILALAALFNLEIEQMDAVTAFLNSDMDREVYMEMPPGWKDENGNQPDRDMVCLLRKALYGLKQAPRLWQKKLRDALSELGLIPCLSDQCVYKNKDTGLIIITHVDDMLIIGKDTAKITQLKQDLNTKFQMDDLGTAAYFLGIRITRDREKRTVSICQDAYIRKILKRFSMENCKHVDTPMASGTQEFMVPYNKKATETETTEYQSMIGSLMYLATNTRPDIMYSVSILSRFLSNPSPQHCNAARRVFQYLKGTIDLAITYGGDHKDENMRLHGFSDADYAACRHTRKSISGYVYFLGGGVIGCSAKRQSTVALSTTEAELYGVVKAAMEGCWLRYLLREIGYHFNDAENVRLYGDNQGALSLAENPEFHQRTKHVDIKYHWIRDMVERGVIDLYYKRTEDMAADGLTKSLSPVKHRVFVKLLKLQLRKP